MTTPPVPGDVLDVALTPEQNPPEWTDDPVVLDVEAVRARADAAQLGDWKACRGGRWPKHWR